MTISDLRIENHGSICIVQPLTGGAKRWLEDNTSEETQWWGGGLCVEPRYLEPLIQGYLSSEHGDCPGCGP